MKLRNIMTSCAFLSAAFFGAGAQAGIVSLNPSLTNCTSTTISSYSGAAFGHSKLLTQCFNGTSVVSVALHTYEYSIYWPTRCSASAYAPYAIVNFYGCYNFTFQ